MITKQTIGDFGFVLVACKLNHFEHNTANSDSRDSHLCFTHALLPFLLLSTQAMQMHSTNIFSTCSKQVRLVSNFTVTHSAHSYALLPGSA